MHRPALLWRPRGAHPARVAIGRNRGTCGMVRQIRSRWGRVRLEVLVDVDTGATENIYVSALRLGPVRGTDRALLPVRSVPNTGVRPPVQPLFDPARDVDVTDAALARRESGNLFGSVVGPKAEVPREAGSVEDSPHRG